MDWLASASSLVGLQLLSRLLTFGLNQAIIVRIASPQVFGTAAIQFELLLSTILFLSREGVRNALLRVNNGNHSTPIRNLSLLPTLVGAPISIAAAILYWTSCRSETRSQPYFSASVGIYAIAAFIELLSEPLYIDAISGNNYRLRVRAEAIAVLSKTLIIFAVLFFLPSPRMGLLAFAAGQIAYAASILATFIRGMQKIPSYLPKRSDPSEPLFDPEMLNLSLAMTGQSFVKHLLTEGDKLIISRISPLADQGGYALASNYGSLVARIFFQPIEETSRLFFSKTLSGANQGRDLKLSQIALESLLLLYAHAALAVLTFGPPYLPFVLQFALPPRYLETSAPRILGAFAYYIPVMAFNGILEAFFAATATPADVRAQSVWMGGFTALYVAASFIFARLLNMGDVGLVYANVINLGIRAWYSWTHASAYLRDRRQHPVKVNIPPAILTAFVGVAAAVRWRGFSELEHLVVGVVGLVLVGLVCLIFERHVIQQGVSLLRRSPEKQD